MRLADIKSPFQILAYNTTRIECRLKDGSTSVGTGFFIFLNDFKNGDDDARPILVTNKHVVKDAKTGYLTLSKIINDIIQPTKHLKIPFDNFESFWHPHPDESIDLCFLNFKLIDNVFNSKGEELFYLPISLDRIATKSTFQELDFVENVYMVGYPNGIWDEVNNKPIFRSGITATNVNIDYEGRPEFLIDMAIFGGSSGSPVLIVDEKLKIDQNNEGYFAKRFILIGILYAGFMQTNEGTIEIVEVPKNIKKAIVNTEIDINLGIVIKADKLFGFRDIFAWPYDDSI